MRELVDKIINKDYKTAESNLREELSKLVALKLEEIKKNEAAKVPDRSIPFDPDIKAHKKPLKKDRPELKKMTKVVKDVVKEAIVHHDGLVHLNTGEKILPSVYRLRRGLTEASGNKAEIADSITTLRDRLPKGHPSHKHLDRAEKALDDNEVGSAIRHYEHAYSIFRGNDDEDKKKKKNLKEDAVDDAGAIGSNIIDRIQRGAKAAIPEKEKEIDATAGQFKEKIPEVMSKARDVLSTLKNQTELKK